MLPSANQKSVVLKCCRFGWAGMAASGLRRSRGKESNEWDERAESRRWQAPEGGARADDPPPITDEADVRLPPPQRSNTGVTTER